MCDSTRPARTRRPWTAPGARPGKWPWLAGRDRHRARKTKRPQIRNQGSQRYACHAATALTAAAPHTASSVARCPACPGWLSEMPTVLSSHLPPTAQ